MGAITFSLGNLSNVPSKIMCASAVEVSSGKAIALVSQPLDLHTKIFEEDILRCTSVDAS
jgi:hypothetical protein